MHFYWHSPLSNLQTSIMCFSAIAHFVNLSIDNAMYLLQMTLAGSQIHTYRSYSWDVVCQMWVSKAETSNYIAQYLWDVITCPCSW